MPPAACTDTLTPPTSKGRKIMTRSKAFASAICAGLTVAGLAIAATGGSASAASAAGPAGAAGAAGAAVQATTSTEAGSAAPFTVDTPSTGRLPGGQRLT